MEYILFTIYFTIIRDSFSMNYVFLYIVIHENWKNQVDWETSETYKEINLYLLILYKTLLLSSPINVYFMF